MSKKTVFVLIGGLLASFVLYWLFFRSSVPITNHPPQNEVIVAFGDSLVAGQGATVGNDFVSLLSDKLGRPIINLGVSGDTTRDGLARLDEVVALDPGTVILLLGGNDYLRRIEVGETEANLSSVIEELQSEGAMIVLLGVRGGVLRDGRRSMYHDLSRRYGTLYVPDVLSGIFGRTELMADSIHPNDAGYAIIADKVYRVLVDQI